MSSLCNSLLIIDEVQSVPKKTIEMFNMAMNFLASYCNTTIVVSSATQPCLEMIEWPLRVSENAEIVELDKDQLGVFDRTQIVDRTTKYGMDEEELKDFCGELIFEHSSLLVICNTKSEARKLYNSLADQLDDAAQIYHLSTSMCQCHREKVLSEILDKLIEQQSDGENAEKPVVCISTQLVEAGIDFSFECVVRVIAGIDNIAQAAGRCNRNGEYGAKCKVYIVNLKNENLTMLPDISEAQNSTIATLYHLKQMDDDNLIGSEATQYFYKSLFSEQSVRLKMKYQIRDNGINLYMTELLACNNPFAKKTDKIFLRQPFKTAGRMFSVFDDHTFDVVVPYEESEQLIEELREMAKYAFMYKEAKSILRRLKKYTISIFQWQKDRLWEAGFVTEMLEGRLLVLDKKAYDERYGLNDRPEQNVEAFIL